MSDIVERLRNYDQGHGYYSALADGAAAEIERLRAALAEITKLPAVDGFCDIEAVRRGQELRLNEQARAIARRALEGK